MRRTQNIPDCWRIPSTPLMLYEIWWRRLWRRLGDRPFHGGGIYRASWVLAAPLMGDRVRTHPWGHGVIVGRGPSGEWAILLDGSESVSYLYPDAVCGFDVLARRGRK